MPIPRHGDGQPLLILDRIRRNWGTREVICDASLTLDRGAVAWVGGPNGAGKTTLLRVIAALIRPEEGKVSVLGLDPESDRRDYQRNLGWLPAGSGGIYNRLSVRQNLAFWTTIAFVPRAQRSQAIEAAIDRFDLQALSDMRADRISMGERQRLRLAMTFVHSPSLVLLDEPHNSLDDSALGRLEAALGELSRRGGAAIWCSPSRDGISLPATEVHLVEDGRLVSC